MLRKTAIWLWLLAMPFTVLAQDDLTITDEEKQAAEAINEARLRAHIKFLSDDLLEGRAPATRGSELAMKYIASQFEEIGLQPGAADGTWFQPFDIIGITSKVPETITLRKGSKNLTLKFWDDFIAFSGVQEPVAEVKDAEIVFVGYGIVAPEYDWDDYKNVDVRGKILLMMNNDPAGDDPNFFGGDARLYYGRWSYKYEIAAKKGAVGAIIIHTTPSAGYPYQVVQTSWTGEQFELPYEGGPKMPLKAWTTEEATRKLVALAGKDLDALRQMAETRAFQPVPLGVKLSIRIENRIRKLKTANVLGLLPGSDPELKNEVVVYSSHHDHLGIGKPVKGDSIYNGALDNASGIAGLLAIAQAFAELPTPPKRSILFAAVAAEESGLLGSEYYAKHPTFPPGKIAANINIDGMNIWGRTRDIVYIGYGKCELDRYAKAIAAQQGRVVKPDQFPDKGYFYRSDQFNFAKIGVPAAYLDSGVDFIGRDEDWGRQQMEQWTRVHYHQPSDEYQDNWDLSGGVEDTQLAFWLGVKVANAPEMPKWYPGDEFEAARKKALSEVK